MTFRDIGASTFHSKNNVHSRITFHSCNVSAMTSRDICASTFHYKDQTLPQLMLTTLRLGGNTSSLYILHRMVCNRCLPMVESKRLSTLGLEDLPGGCCLGSLRLCGVVMERQVFINLTHFNNSMLTSGVS